MRFYEFQSNKLYSKAGVRVCLSSDETCRETVTVAAPQFFRKSRKLQVRKGHIEQVSQMASKSLTHDCFRGLLIFFRNSVRGFKLQP